MQRNTVERAGGASAVLSLWHSGMSHLSPALAATLQRVRGKKLRERLWNPWINKQDLWLSGSLTDVLLAPLSNIFFRDGRVPRSPPGDSRWQRGITLSLPLPLVFPSCFVCYRQEIRGLSSFPWVNQQGRLHANEIRGLYTQHNPGTFHKASWVSVMATVNN